ncbi:hypothetical protein F0562_022848 [Nyssa sinensis]|uniref:phospholipase D n=1 Tax=Nyssa sinensis TaxID=561372 RepID=A0A5J5BGC6_9ASTE|nr:hypothetical protein F0562_022848 [Nyssa sinensis]
MSFVGGLDLCDGRYDTEEHSLFQTLNTESHCHDFYQTSLAGASLHKGGPREPWHDAHARIVGEAAWDVLTNFEQRWTKQCDPSLLVPISTITDLCHQPTPTSIPTERDWKVQVFRSIDHVSASQMPKNFTVERSIHEAYVEAIRHAERFIYIENQYFIGGCHLWEKDQHCGCRNLIPIEIALKVRNKIKAKERFAVYILIPMWPEGVPESEPVQDILHWTRETMKMMYMLIGEAIRESGEAGHPRDYLNFFCLANRENEGKGEFVPPHSPHPATEYWNAQKHRRFMVYVHSKLMIVDDTYMLIGSANVNQRSMDGQRDTEIAIGCYQKRNGENKMSHESIHAYRMSLWYEHTGRAEELFREPHSLECIQRIHSIGEQMWKIYCSEEVIDMEGVHLVSYPVSVTKDGDVDDLVDGGSHFPDTKTPVKGKRSKIYVATNPRGAESLPPGIVEPYSDLYLHRVQGNPSEDLVVKPKYLLALTVGYLQKDIINRIVTKFSENFTIVLFHYDGRDKWYAKRFLHPDIVAQYEYVFIWDEDLGVEQFNAEEYIKLVKKHGLEISQPAIESKKGKLRANTVGVTTHIGHPVQGTVTPYSFISKNVKSRNQRVTDTEGL